MDPSGRRSGGSSGGGGGGGGGGDLTESSLDFPNLPTTISLTPILSTTPDQTIPPPAPPTLSRYESQKRRDWNTFLHYLQNHKPPLSLPRCSGAHVIEFLRYLDQFGKTKVHSLGCAFFGHPSPPGPCACPLRQAWGSLDALIGRLRAAYDESGGIPDTNPFASRAVRFYLRDVRDSQAKARGIPYHKKKRKRPLTDAAVAESSSSRSDVGLDEVQGSTSTGGAEAGGRSSSSSSAS